MEAAIYLQKPRVCLKCLLIFWVADIFIYYKVLEYRRTSYLWTSIQL